MRYCGRFRRFIKVDLVKIVSVFWELSEGSCQLSVVSCQRGVSVVRGELSVVRGELSEGALRSLRSLRSLKSPL